MRITYKHLWIMLFTSIFCFDAFHTALASKRSMPSGSEESSSKKMKLEDRAPLLSSAMQEAKQGLFTPTILDQLLKITSEDLTTFQSESVTDDNIDCFIAVLLACNQLSVYPNASQVTLSRAENKENAIAQNNLGCFYAKGLGGLVKDGTKAREWCEKAAAQGYPAAQSDLAGYYAKGRGGLVKDETKAREWFEKAAAQGYPTAQYSLAAAYANGLGGLVKDETKAREWFEKAAAQGLPAAQNDLAGYYAQGRGGLVKDKTKAREWFEKAAAQRHPTAQYNLAGYYAQGRGGLSQNTGKAIEYRRRSAHGGHKPAQTSLKEFIQLSPASNIPLPDPSAIDAKINTIHKSIDDLARLRILYNRHVANEPTFEDYQGAVKIDIISENYAKIKELYFDAKIEEAFHNICKQLANPLFMNFCVLLKQDIELQENGFGRFKKSDKGYEKASAQTNVEGYSCFDDDNISTIEVLNALSLRPKEEMLGLLNNLRISLLSSYQTYEKCQQKLPGAYTQEITQLAEEIDHIQTKAIPALDMVFDQITEIIDFTRGIRDKKFREENAYLLQQ